MAAADSDKNLDPPREKTRPEGKDVREPEEEIRSGRVMMESVKGLGTTIQASRPLPDNR